MRFLSLFSGIEAASVAWGRLGWECAAVAEIDPFACAVLAYHYPHTPNLGDVTRISEGDIASLGHIDVVIFGSPCQDLSIAGKREGLAGVRSGLFLDAIRIVGWARKHCGLRWALWENVPGSFSSNAGRDFAIVVAELAGLDATPEVPPKGWGNEGAAVGPKGLVEWATLDSQWFGVAQRRRRVFALADFGDWSARPPVLLEPQSLRGDSAPRREASAAIEPAAAQSVDEIGSMRYLIPEVAACLTTGTGQRYDPWTETLLPVSDKRVRNMTPVECERAQGFPDNYTRVPYRNAPADRCPSTPRYKTLGNSMTTDVIHYIGKRIEFAQMWS